MPKYDKPLSFTFTIKMLAVAVISASERQRTKDGRDLVVIDEHGNIIYCGLSQEFFGTQTPRIHFTLHTLKNVVYLLSKREDMGLGSDKVMIDEHGVITQGSNMDSVAVLSCHFRAKVYR